MKKTILESDVQADIIKYLRQREWFVKNLHGHAYQFGLPDLFASHYKFGHRWIEVKVPPGHKFTSAQLETFQALCAHGSGVWILCAATNEEYVKLFKSPNWHHYISLIK
jgi:hypothetical protein